MHSVARWVQVTRRARMEAYEVHVCLLVNFLQVKLLIERRLYFKSENIPIQSQKLGCLFHSVTQIPFGHK